MGSSNSGLYATVTHGEPPLPDSYEDEPSEIGRSLGAAAMNYDVRDPKTGRYYRFAEGTKITDVVTFAGKGTGKSLRREVVSGLTREFGGRPSDWKHSKGIGTIDRGYKYQDAEVHWFENKGAKVGFKIKEWL